LRHEPLQVRRLADVFSNFESFGERFGALTPDITLKGLIAGSSLMSGTFIAKRFVLKFDADTFRLVMDGIMIVAGLAMPVGNPLPT
jgi:hypothetical protein